MMLNMKYLISLHKTEYGYDVSVPSLPGCHSQGDSEKEALENIEDAIRAYYEMQENELVGTEIKEIDVAFV